LEIRGLFFCGKLTGGVERGFSARLKGKAGTEPQNGKMLNVKCKSWSGVGESSGLTFTFFGFAFFGFTVYRRLSRKRDSKNAGYLKACTEPKNSKM
jgi:hypothetical protein